MSWKDQIKWKTTSPMMGDCADFHLRGSIEIAGVLFESSKPVSGHIRNHGDLIAEAKVEVIRRLREKINRRRAVVEAEYLRWKDVADVV